MLPWIGTMKIEVFMLWRGSAAVNYWMLHNGLTLYPDKSEAIIFGTSRAIASSKIKSVTVAGSAITISDKVKSLEVTLDKCLIFDRHVKGVVYSNTLPRQIAGSHSKVANPAETIESSIVARLDYCNYRLVRTSDANLQRLQITQMQLLVSSAE